MYEQGIGLVDGLREGRRAIARYFEEQARADAEAMASMERKADRVIDLLAVRRVAG